MRRTWKKSEPGWFIDHHQTLISFITSFTTLTIRWEDVLWPWFLLRDLFHGTHAQTQFLKRFVCRSIFVYLQYLFFSIVIQFFPCSVFTQTLNLFSSMLCVFGLYVGRSVHPLAHSWVSGSIYNFAFLALTDLFAFLGSGAKGDKIQ